MAQEEQQAQKKESKKIANCGNCSKPLKRIKRYYRNSKYYCSKKCFLKAKNKASGKADDKES